MTPQTVNVATPTQFGTGNGTATQFNVIPAVQNGVSAIINAIYRKDWQGTQQLYQFPRYNLLHYSQDITQSSYWQASASTAASTTYAAPDGTIFSCTLTDSTANAQHLVNNLGIESVTGVWPNNGIGQVVTFSVWLAVASGQRYVALQLWDGTNGAYAIFDLVGGVISKAATAIGLGANQNAKMVAYPSGGWYRCSITCVVDQFSQAYGCNVILCNSGTSTAAYAGSGTNAVYVWGLQLENSAAPTSLIVTTSTKGVTTDFQYGLTDAAVGTVYFATAPALNAVLSWTGAYTYTPSISQTVLMSQYANSPIMLALINDFEQYFNPAANISAFYSNVLNLNTATGYGLDVWGRILGVARTLSLGTGVYFGFTGVSGRTATSGDSFGGGPTTPSLAPWYSGQNSSNNYTLSDSAYRVLLLAKALANISYGSSQAINQLLINLFIKSVPGRTGNAYVTDGLNMTMTYSFTVRPVLTSAEVAIITQSGVLPRPTAVSTSLVQY